MIRKIFVAAAALSMLSLAACEESLAPVDDGSTVEVEQAISSTGADNSCHFNCQPCPPNQVCVQTCTLVGNCTNSCDVIALCAPGYHWDTTACQCLPEPNTGEDCGPTVCGAGQECCNASCGICTEPGGFCTQQVCDFNLQ